MAESKRYLNLDLRPSRMKAPKPTEGASFGNGMCYRLEEKSVVLERARERPGGQTEHIELAVGVTRRLVHRKALLLGILRQ